MCVFCIFEQSFGPFFILEKKESYQWFDNSKLAKGLQLNPAKVSLFCYDKEKHCRG